MLGLACSKIQEFLCFQVSQATRITKELSPFCNSFGMSRRPFLHQLENLVSDVEGTRAGRLRAWRIENHICLVKTHPTRMCCMVSSSWSQKGQTSETFSYKFSQSWNYSTSRNVRIAFFCGRREWFLCLMFLDAVQCNSCYNMFHTSITY